MLAPIAVVVLLAMVAVGTTPPAGAVARGGADPALLMSCAKAVLGVGSGSATPVVGSAAPQLVAELAVFREERSAANALPKVSDLADALAEAGAITYDPSAGVLLKRNGTQGGVYGIPATMALAALPAGCNSLPQFAGVGAYHRAAGRGDGQRPGCVSISIQREQSATGTLLPGATAPKPTETLVVAQADCESEGVLSGYIGALGDELAGVGTQLALIPDGVNSIAYTLADGRQFTVPVAGNLAIPPAALSIPTSARTQTLAGLEAQLAARSASGRARDRSGAYAIASLPRPASLIPNVVGSFSFLRRLLSSSSAFGTSSSNTSGTGASCSVRTHRCVAVIVTTTCNNRERCTTRRTIYRYRYVGAKPPLGTTGPDTQPTAPIVARTNQFIKRPVKPTLVLSGAPHRHVVVLLSVSCFSRHSSASIGGPPLNVGVPSRTPIALPGRAHTFQACDIGALVTSNERGSVHVTVARS